MLMKTQRSRFWVVAIGSIVELSPWRASRSSPPNSGDCPTAGATTPAKRTAMRQYSRAYLRTAVNMGNPLGGNWPVLRLSQRESCFGGYVLRSHRSFVPSGSDVKGADNRQGVDGPSILRGREK